MAEQNIRCKLRSATYAQPLAYKEHSFNGDCDHLYF